MAEPDKKRRLPILQNTAPAEEAETEARPPWHWSGIGVVITFLSWLPIAAAIAALTVRLSSNTPTPSLGILVVALHLLGFWIAAFLGGFFIGKFGGEAGPKEGAVSGFVTAAFAVALAAASPGQGATLLTWAMLLAIVGGSGAAMGFGGAKIGKKRRSRLPK